MKESLLDVTYQILTEVSEKEQSFFHIVLNPTLYRPIFQKSDKMYLELPVPRMYYEKIRFYGYPYDDYEAQEDMWGLFTASLYHVAGHAKLSDYNIYEKWQNHKTQDVTWRVIDTIEDIRVSEYLRENFPTEYKNMELINNSIDDFNKKYASTIQSPIKKFRDYFFKNENLNFIIKKIDVTQDTSHEILQIADHIYLNQMLLPTFMYPYMESHAIKSNVINYLWNYPTLNLKDPFKQLSKLLGEMWIESIQKNQRTLQKFLKLTSDLQFDSVTIGKENFGEYLRLKNESALFLKKLRNQLKMVSNIVDDPNSEDLGLVEMQKAIQAISSDNSGIQIFEQDVARRTDENWAIIVDTSQSMKARFNDIKKFTLCLAETADELSSRGGSWGLFSFSNDFVIIKDQEERYTQQVKARIGGIENKGLSFIADSITLTARIMNGSSTDKKFIFIITDGNALGYAEADQKFQESINLARKAGISIIGIGVPNGKVKNFTMSLSYSTMRKTVANFIGAYVELAASSM